MVRDWIQGGDSPKVPGDLRKQALQDLARAKEMRPSDDPWCSIYMEVDLPEGGNADWH